MASRGRALFERNANACETAKHPSCSCRCHGALHGVAHSAQWRAQTWTDLQDERQQEREAAQQQLVLDGLPLTRVAQ